MNFWMSVDGGKKIRYEEDWWKKDGGSKVKKEEDGY